MSMKRYEQVGNKLMNHTKFLVFIYLIEQTIVSRKKVKFLYSFNYTFNINKSKLIIGLNVLFNKPF